VREGRPTQEVAVIEGARLVAFAASTDLARSRAFYEGVLGLAVVSADPYACEFDCAGTTLRVNQVEQVAAAVYTVLGWEVPDIAAAVTDLAERGVTFSRFAGMDQDDLGVWTAPGGAQVAWFADPDGNTLSLSHHAA